MLTDTSDISSIISTLHSQIQQYAGVNPATVPILVTETNSNVDMDMDTQPNALFAADMYATWLENGVTNVDWWDEHNGPGTNPPSTVGGVEDYGDYGIFSDGGTSDGVTEPAAETPFAPYYGIEMLSKLGAPGDTMVSSSSGNPLVHVHAVRRAGGGLDVLIDNEDPSNGYTANLSLGTFTPTGDATVYTLSNNSTTITSAIQSSASSVLMGAYSLAVIQIPGSGGTGTSAPGASRSPMRVGTAPWRPTAATSASVSTAPTPPSPPRRPRSMSTDPSARTTECLAASPSRCACAAKASRYQRLSQHARRAQGAS